MKNPHPYEKFSAAIHSMATSPAPLQRRLHDAYVDNLMHVKAEDVPESVRHQFSSLANELRDALWLNTAEAVEKASLVLSIADVVQSEYFGS